MSELLIVWGRSLMQVGLVVLVQTTLLLVPGLWALHLLQKRNPGARSLLGRTLLLATLATIVLSGGLALGGRGRLPALWNVSLPENYQTTMVANVTSRLAESRLARAPESLDKPEATASKTSRRAPNQTVTSESPTLMASQEPISTTNRVSNARSAFRPASLSQNTRGWLWAAGAVWLAGTLILLTWWGACHGALMRLQRKAQPVTEAGMTGALAEVCATLGVRTPQLLCHRAAGSPFLTGLLRPAIVLPAGGVPLDEAALRAVLLHETMHLKRRDLWWNALGHIGCALLWPQPLLWMLCRRLEEISEEACDEAVVRGGCERQHYARCLLDWAENMTTKKAERVAGAGVLAGRSTLSRRVQAILEGSPRASRRVSKRLRWMIVSSVLLSAVATPLLVSIKADDRKPLQSGSSKSSTKSVAPTGREAFPQVKDTGDYRVILGGVVKGVLQSVMFLERRNGQTRALFIADRVRRQAIGSTRWIFADGTAYRFSDENGLESQTNFKQIILDLPQLTEFLEQQAQSPSHPAPPDRQAMRRAFQLPIAEMNKLKAWAKGRDHATVTGRVVDEDGQPIAGARVWMVMSSEAVDRILNAPKKNGFAEIYPYQFALPKTTRNILAQSAVSGPDGSYRVTGLADVTYDLDISGYGRQTRFNRPKRNFELPAHVSTVGRRVAASSGKTVSAPDVVLTSGGLLNVRIQDKATGAPLPDITLLAEPKTTASTTKTTLHRSSYWVDTDAEGLSPFRLPDGKVNLAIGGQSPPGVNETVTTSNGVLYRIGNGAEISTDGGAPRPFEGSTDIQIVKGQKHEVLLRLQRYVAPVPRPAPPRKPPPAGKATITGRVVDESGRPVGGIPVLATMQTTARSQLAKNAGLVNSNASTPNWKARWASIESVLSQNAVTQADGTYMLKGLTTAPYNLIIGSTPAGSFGMRPPSGWVAPAVEGTWAKEGQIVRRTQPIVLTRGALIRGRVVDKATGQPLGGVILGSNGPQLPTTAGGVMEAKTDAQGRFTFRVVSGSTSIYIAGPSIGGPSINDWKFVYADDGKIANAYRIRTNRGPYAGGGRLQYELDNGKPLFTSNSEYSVKIQARNGQTRNLTLRLRRVAPKKD